MWNLLENLYTAQEVSTGQLWSWIFLRIFTYLKQCVIVQLGAGIISMIFQAFWLICSGRTFGSEAARDTNALLWIQIYMTECHYNGKSLFALLRNDHFGARSAIYCISAGLCRHAVPGSDNHLIDTRSVGTHESWAFHGNFSYILHWNYHLNHMLSW